MAWTLAIAALLLGAPPARAQSAVRPNVIMIMADDLAWPFYGFMRDIDRAKSDPNDPRYEALKNFPHPTSHPEFPLPDAFVTPNIDRLAARGAVFPMGHSGDSLCLPSFQTTLTGLYRKDFGAKPPHRGREPYIPEYLAQAGYQSFGFGKLWQPSYAKAGFTCVKGACDVDSVHTKSGGRTTLTPLLRFLQNAPQPFFAWYAPDLPHAPTNAGSLVRSTLLGGRASGLDLTPPQILSGGELRLEGLYEQMQVLKYAVKLLPTLKERGDYLKNIMLLDYWVGELLNFLEAPGNEELNRNTMIIFMSDNGYKLPNSKRKFSENGVRTPILVSWPGADSKNPEIPPGQVLPQMVHAVDIVPTLLDYAGMPIRTCDTGEPVSFPAFAYTGTTVPSSADDPCLEGQSMRPYLQGADLPGRSDLLGMWKKGWRYLRTVRMEPPFAAPQDQSPIAYRLLRAAPRARRGKKAFCKYELYDLTADPNEKHDLLKSGEFDNSDRSLDLWKLLLTRWFDPGDCVNP